MLTLYDAISTLLLQYDQVAVPGLGTFRCQYRSASVNVITNQFEKPACALAFDAEVDPDDRRLVDYLSEQRGVTESQAREVLERFVTDLQERLKEEGSVAFPGLGRLSLDVQGKPTFTPEQDQDGFGDSFGLADLNPEPVITGTKTDDWRAVVASQIKDINTPMTVDEEAMDYYEELHRRRRNRWILGGTLAVIAIIAFVLWRLLLLNPTITEAPTPHTPWIDTVEKPKPVVTDTVAIDTLVAIADTVLSPDTPETLTPEVTPDTTPHAFIIGGCFSIKENAEAMVASLKEQGYPNAYVMKRGSKFFVCYDHYATADEAEEALVHVKQDNNSKAWILTKP